MTDRILTMPRLGETMDEGKIVGWMIKPGDFFKRGEPILEIETDKTVAEFPALGDGRLTEILVSIGNHIEVGKPLARIDIGDGPDWISGESEIAEASPTMPATHPSQDRNSAAAGSSAEQRAPQRPAPSLDAETERSAANVPTSPRQRATPLARSLARRHDIDIARISGTGRRGRVEKADVLAAVGAPLVAGASASPELKYASLSRGRMAYLDCGSASGNPVLLLHGFSADRTTWAPLTAGLKRAGRRVIVPDLPGHGSTEIDAAAVDDLGADLLALLDALGIETVDVVAHSLGALAATDLASKAPVRVRSLSLIAPAGLGPEIDDSFIQGMANATAAGEVAHLLRRLSVNRMELSETALQSLTKTLARRRLTGLARAVAGPSGQMTDSVASIERLSAHMPVRVLFGLEDKIIPWKHVKNLSPRVAIHLLARSGHMPQSDQTRDVLDILQL